MSIKDKSRRSLNPWTLYVTQKKIKRREKELIKIRDKKYIEVVWVNIVHQWNYKKSKWNKYSHTFSKYVSPVITIWIFLHTYVWYHSEIYPKPFNLAYHFSPLKICTQYISRTNYFKIPSPPPPPPWPQHNLVWFINLMIYLIQMNLPIPRTQIYMLQIWIPINTL